MKNIKMSLVAIACVVGMQSFAQGRPSLSIGAELGIPVGDLNLTQKIGIGGSAKFALPVATGTDLTLSAGYMSFSGDEYNAPGNLLIKRPALNFIPIKAGVRFKVQPASGFYLEPQLGYTSVNTPNSNTTASGGFTYAANAGYMFSKQVDLSARYEGVSLKNNVNFNFVGARLAYNFSL